MREAENFKHFTILVLVEEKIYGERQA